MQKSVMRRAVLAGAVSLAVLVLAAGCGGSGHDDMGGMNHGGSAATASSKRSQSSGGPGRDRAPGRSS